MRVRTLLAITLTIFALPALAAKQPPPPKPPVLWVTPPHMPQPLPCRTLDATGNSDVSVVFEVRTITAPVGLCERAGVKLAGDGMLTADQTRRIIEAAQASPEANIMQFPKVTADDGQTVTVRNCEQRCFVTGVDAVRVKGQTVVVPKNTSVELGDTLTLSGQVSPDAKTVTFKANLKRVRVVGSAELIPVVSKVTPVFEGGSHGTPIPFTQYIQSPEIKTEKVEKSAVLPAGGTIVLGGWKETAEPVEQPTRPKLLPKKVKPAKEYEVVVLATVRILHAEEPAVAPMPREAVKLQRYPLRNVAAAEAAAAITKYLEGKNLKGRVTFDVTTNAVFVQAERVLLEKVSDILAALDKTPTQVLAQAMVVQVPRGFLEAAGLTIGNDCGGKAWALSPREMRMLTALLRAAKEKGECDVLSRPQICVTDNQTGFVQVGQNFPVQTVSLVKKAEGTVAVESKVVFVPTGLSMWLTPRVSPDGKSIHLRTEGKLTTVAPTTVALGKPEDPQNPRAPVFITQQVTSTMKLRPGETLVVAMVGGETGGRSFLGEFYRRCSIDTFETLVIVTPSLVHPEPVRPAAGWFVK